MAKKKSVKKRVVKREAPVQVVHTKRVVKREAPVQVVHTQSVERSRLNIDKSDGLIAIMAAVLVTLIAILDKTYSVIAAVLMMIVFAAYKLIMKR